MSNSLNLGSGNWATKDNSLLGYNSENGNFKPLPFDFSRGSIATVINKQGLIETVQANNARVDYLDNAKGALLLEPSRTNLVPYSEDLTQWGNVLYTLVESNSTLSPDGSVNADKLVAGATNGLQLRIAPLSLTSGNTYTFSTYVKNSGGNYVILYMNDTDSQGIKVDLVNETFVTMGSSTNHFIKNFGNGWYQIGFTRAIDANVNGLNAVPSLDGNNVSFLGDGVNGVFIWGTQVELGSYPTSIIKTQGTAQTRLVDSCNQTTPAGVIGQTEGVVYMDFLSVNNFDGSSGNLFQIKEDNNNRINIYFSNGTPRLFGIENSSGVFNQSLSLTTGSVCKLAIKYNSTSTKVYINGSLSHTLNGINNIAFNNFLFSPNNNINYNEIKLYNTALTDEELVALTTI